MRLLLAALCLLASASAGPVSQQQMVIEVTPTTEDQVKILTDAADSLHDVDFWVHPRVGESVPVRLTVSRFNQLKREWTNAGLQIAVRHENLEAHLKQAAADDERYRLTHPYSTSAYQTSLTHNLYRTYAQIEAALVTLRNQFPSLVTFDQTGNTPARERTSQNRVIHVVQVTANSNAPVIFMEVNIHSREWITGAANLFLLDWLLTNYGTNPDATFILNNFRIVNIPIANPDGYEYTHASSANRYWRKNRRSITASCIGVDLNRNFDHQWGASASGSSGTCSSDSYRGPSSASEPETRAIKALFQYFESNSGIYLSVHAFSQYVLLPWTYQLSSSPINAYHTTVGRNMASAMTAVENRLHTAGTAYGLLNYNADGATIDWAMNRRQAVNPNFLAMAYELRPGSSNSISDFNIPASNIVPAGHELRDSFLVAARAYYERTRNSTGL